MADQEGVKPEGEKPEKPDQEDSPNQKKANSDKAWTARFEKCERVRKQLKREWSDSVDYRRGKPFDVYDDDKDRVNVNIDWALTENKHAQLFSQMPQVYLKAKQPQFQQGLTKFQKQLNDSISEVGVGDAINESLYDVINASGFGACIVGYETLTEKKAVPVMDGQPVDMGKIQPDLQMALLQSKRLQTQEIDQVLDHQFYCDRFSPSDLLWPLEFNRSNFDKADWLGRSGKILWSEAKNKWNLDDEDKEKIARSRGRDDNLRRNEGSESDYGDDDVVEYREAFYWMHKFDPDEKSYKKIGHVLFIKGKKDSIFNKPWEGQHVVEGSNKIIGPKKFPIRVLTLTYISDDAIPPSSSAIGRPQVEEMVRSRTQIVMQRDRSQPIRWYDVNGMDPQIGDNLQHGVYEGFIPMNGSGDKRIGEVARASYPREDFEFDNIIRQDLNEQWAMGPNQQQSFNKGRRSAAEAQLAQQSFQTRVGYERARVSEFLVGIAEVLGGLIAMVGDFEILNQQEIQQIDQSWDRRQLGQEFEYWIRPDSTVLLDANQRIDKLMKALNLTGKSGFVNPKPLIQEIIELHGIDTEGVIIDPQPPKPKDPQISYRFSGVADLTNPIALALMAKSGQLPTPEDIQKAQQVLQLVDALNPMLPGGGQQPQGQGQPGQGQAGMPGPPQAATPKLPGQQDANPGWTGMGKVFKRNQDATP